MLKTLSLTALALLAFAANSLLARAGLLSPDMGPIEFTLIRLMAGAAALMLLLSLRKEKQTGSWAGASMLLLYALMFSLAYVILDTGTGALCLFASVQLTILSVAAVKRELSWIEVVGASIAFGGFIYLVYPNITSPDWRGVVLMILSGIGWGFYTILGRSTENPLALTSGNFMRAAILALPLLVYIFPSPLVTSKGVVLAITSGAITSGIGYAIWYAALPRMSAAMSGVSQLSVPPIAAVLGWVCLGEVLGLRFAVATFIIIVGLLVVMFNRTARTP